MEKNRDSAKEDFNAHWKALSLDDKKVHINMSSNLIYLTQDQAAEKQARANNTLAKVRHNCHFDSYMTFTNITLS